VTGNDPQLEIARALQPLLRENGFVIAGGQAVKLNGYSERPTEDLDLFTNSPDINISAFALTIEAQLRGQGLAVETLFEMSSKHFARLTVQGEESSTRLDLAYDCRERAPRNSPWGLVLHPDDSAVSKMNALWARREVRDAIDVAGMVASGDYSSDQLMVMLARSDSGFDTSSFLAALKDASEYRDKAFATYGLNDSQSAKVRKIFIAWLEQNTPQ
jgi:hypothetical protein